MWLLDLIRRRAQKGAGERTHWGLIAAVQAWPCSMEDFVWRPYKKAEVRH